MLPKYRTLGVFVFMATTDVLGQVFNRLTVISEYEKSQSGITRYLCICECGNETIVQRGNLLTGHTRSCGCFLIQSRYDKGDNSKKPEYVNWRKMKERCVNQNSDKYHYYGGKGITICDRWVDSFVNFYEDMGPKPSPKHSVERKNGKLGYFKENCVWATKREQMSNISSNRWIEYEGRRMIFSDWAREFNVNPSSLRQFIKNRTFEEAVIHYRNRKIIKNAVR